MYIAGFILVTLVYGPVELRAEEPVRTHEECQIVLKSNLTKAARAFKDMGLEYIKGYCQRDKTGTI